MNDAEIFTFLATIGAITAVAEFLAVLLIGAVLLVVLIVTAVILPIRARRRRQAELAEPIDEREQLEDVAQAIADCYGHGPLAVMDPQYQHEFRRDARAALKAMRGPE